VIKQLVEQLIAEGVDDAWITLPESQRLIAQIRSALASPPPDEPPPLREPDHDADCAVQKGPSKMNRLVCTCAQPAPPDEPEAHPREDDGRSDAQGQDRLLDPRSAAAEKRR